MQSPFSHSSDPDPSPSATYSAPSDIALHSSFTGASVDLQCFALFRILRSRKERVATSRPRCRYDTVGQFRSVGSSLLGHTRQFFSRRPEAEPRGVTINLNCSHLPSTTGVLNTQV